VTALLAFAGSVAFGTADFVGGAVSRRAPGLWVAAYGQSLAFVFSLPLVLLVGWDHLTAADAGWSLTSGAVGAVGLGIFYPAMARGLISVVAPVTSVVGASIPVAYGFIRGERPGTVAVVGIALALAAVAIVSVSPSDSGEVALAPIAASVAAGVCFGSAVVLFARTSEAGGLWPVALSRATSSLVLTLLALMLSGTRLPRSRLVLRACLAIGVLETAGNALLVHALQLGPVAIASVLVSLYPVTAVLLATVVLGERLSPTRRSGVALALVAVVLISAG
jgi:drug/metabolite transporter (DMT)-like permease